MIENMFIKICMNLCLKELFQKLKILTAIILLPYEGK